MVNSPHPHESLGEYVKRMRISHSLSQNQLADKASIHLQSQGLIERGKTTKLNQKTIRGLAYALQIPTEYLDAVIKRIPISASKSLKFCPHCWTPGTPPEDMWTNVRAKCCFLCGTRLRNSCVNCHEPITSLKFRFCPYCGFSFKKDVLVKSI
jgi:DNA-binding XRE family transcriptional regulator